MRNDIIDQRLVARLGDHRRLSSRSDPAARLNIDQLPPVTLAGFPLVHIILLSRRDERRTIEVMFVEPPACLEASGEFLDSD